MAVEYNATVSGRVEIAPGLIILRVVPDTLPFQFKAGQYVVLGVKASLPEGASSCLGPKLRAPPPPARAPPGPWPRSSPARRQARRR
jgi:NAD(P)H-flavin reductase